MDTLFRIYRYAQNGSSGFFVRRIEAAMNATEPDPSRYTERKAHPCGCTTVWDTQGGGPRYVGSCGLHRRYAHHWRHEPAVVRCN